MIKERSATVDVDYSKTKEFLEIIKEKNEITGVTNKNLEFPVSNIFLIVL